MKNHSVPRALALPAALLLLLGGCGSAQGAESAAPASSEPLSSSSAAPEEEAASPAADALTLVSDPATTQYFTDEAVAEEDLQTILAAGVNAQSAMNGQPWHFSAVTDAGVLEEIAGAMSAGRPAGGPPAGALPEGASLPEDVPEAAPEAPEAAPEGEGEETAAPAEAAGDGEAAASAPAKAGIADAPLAIVVSCPEGSEFDAGLACQSMSQTAQLLGYGTKIISSPTMVLNGEDQAEYRELLGIPEDCSAAAVLLVGRADTTVDETADGYTAATARNPLEEMVTYVTGE